MTAADYRRRLTRRKYYYPDESNKQHRYRILCHHRVGNGLIMLARHGADHVVLRWRDVQPGYVPEDKWMEEGPAKAYYQGLFLGDA